MPLYEYQCDACGKRFEVIQKFSDPALEVCRLCEQGPVHKLLSSPAIQFKGSGWYITDYAQKGKDSGKKSGGDKGTDAGGKSDAAKSDSPATKTESKSDSSSTAGSSTPKTGE